MRCEEVTELMQRSLDEDLSPEEFAEMEKHLGECAECQSLFEGLKHISAELENLPEVEPPVSLVDSILPQIMPEGTAMAPKAGSSISAPAKRDWKRLAIFSGSAAAVLILGIFSAKWLMSPPFGSQENMESAQVAEKSSPSTAMNADQATNQVNESKAANEASRELSDQAESLPANQTVGKQTNSDKQMTALADPEKSQPNEKAESFKADQTKQPDQSEARSGAVKREPTEPTQSAEPKQQARSAETVEENAEPQMAMSSAAPEQASKQAAPREEEMALSSPEPAEPQMAMLAPSSETSLAAKNAPPADVYPSPTGRYSAYVEGQMVVVSDEEGAEVFRSHQWKESAQVMIKWESDDLLVYQIRPVTDAKDASSEPERWEINVKDGQEQKQ